MRQMRFGRGAVVLLPALLAVKCSPSPGRQPGELGNGVFYWLCAAASDPSCEDMESAAKRFPSVVALGSAFQLQYQENSGRYLAPHSGSSHLTEGSPTGTFTAVNPGFASIVVYSGDEILDFLHIDVQPVESLQMSSAGIDVDGIDVGSSATVQVTALCTGEPCAGALPYQWAVDRPDLVSLQSPAGPDDVVSLTALAPGLVTVLVTANDSAGSLQFLVRGELPTGDTGMTITDTTVTDTITDTGTITDTTITDTGTDTTITDIGATTGDTGGPLIDTGVTP